MKKNFLQIWWLDYHDSSISGIFLGSSNQSYEYAFIFDESIFLFLEPFFWRKLYWCPNFFFITKSFSLHTSDKTTSWINSSCSTICWGQVGGILLSSSTTIISTECSLSYLASKASSSAIVLILLSHYVSINFFFWTPFLLFFSRNFYWSTRFLCLLTSLSLTQSWIFSVTFCLVSEFLFFVLFWMLWILVTVNKLKNPTCHGSHASQITSSKTLFAQFF